MFKNFVLLATTLCVFTVAASAQTITGSITGTVSDPSGAVIANAKVAALNTATNVQFATTTSQSGVYNIVFLPVGEYNLAVENTGFKKSVIGPFKLEVNQIARLDVSLQVGESTQTVEVTSVAPILQTESTATGDTITSTKLTSLPLNGRNFATLTLLIPGAISTSPNAMNTSARFQGSGSRPQVNGNREQTNNFLLDGVDVNDSIDNRIGYQPNVDALEEVKVITGNAGGEFGNVGGGSVMMSIKSGTNAYHAAAFEFIRNDKLDANGFFPNRNSTARAAFRRNIFGGTFGGPIKKNKLFFFTDYEGTEQRTSGAATASVAPQSWRNGDLSQLGIIKDPLTGPDVGSRTAFVGSIIPATRINPVARFLFANPNLYPLPNKSGTGSLGVSNNYISASRNSLSNKQGDVKVDWRPNDKDNFAARYSMGQYDQIGSQAALPTSMTGGTNGPTLSAMFNWTRTISAHLVLDARIGFSRVGIDDLVVDWSGLLGAAGNSKFGIAGGQPIPGLSSIGLGNGLSSIGSGASIGSTRDNKYQEEIVATYLTGSHVIKAGGQLLRMQQNRYYAGNNGALGSFGYDGSYTGQAYGDFITNALATKGRGAVTGKWGHRQWRNALFVQDDWKVRRNLTLNLGMRWEYNTPIQEVADRQVNINTYTGELILPGSGPYGRALYKSYKKQFQPTLGIAWTPEAMKGKMVVRAGYRFSSYLEGTGANLRLPLNPPFFVESNVVYDQRSPGSVTTGFSDVIAAGSLTGPRSSPTAAPFFQARAWDLDLKPQQTNQYNFSTEYQVDKTTSLTVAYVGNHATHLVVPHEANQPLPGTGPTSTWAPLNDRRPLFKSLPNVGNIALTESSGTSRYNSLQVTARHRMGGGFEALAAYTFSKTLTDNLGYYGCGSTSAEGAYWQNAYDRHANFGPACFDARHNFTVGGLYELPVGKGHKFGSGMTKAMNLIAGGWNANYFVSRHTGFPVTVTSGSANTLQAVRGNTRANAYTPLNVGAGTNIVDQFFGAVYDPATKSNVFCAAGVYDGKCAFGTPGVGSFGSGGVGTLRAPTFFNLDASVGKKFYLTEKHYLDFRMEMFNMLNHASFGPPQRNINDPANFGAITSQVQNPRNIQFGLKYMF